MHFQQTEIELIFIESYSLFHKCAFSFHSEERAHEVEKCMILSRKEFPLKILNLFHRKFVCAMNTISYRRKNLIKSTKDGNLFACCVKLWYGVSSA